MRFAIALLALLLFLLPMLQAEFLVGSGNVGQKISMLCENQSAVFVSGPSGESLRLALDENHQSEFTPDVSGPYAIQCGHEAKTIEVASEAAKAEPAAIAQGDFFALFALLAFFAFFMAATALAADYLFFSRAMFAKTVENGRAKLVLRAGKGLEKIEIADPVAIGFGGGEMRFSIPRLDAGKQWAFEYEMEAPQNALPASLEARVSGQTVSMLFNLHIEGQPKGADSSEEKPRIKRKVPKAHGRDFTRAL